MPSNHAEGCPFNHDNTQLNPILEVEPLFDGKRLQKRVDEYVRIRGGYYPPLSGLATLSQKVGKLSEIVSTPLVAASLKENCLVDVYLSSLALSNQYCADLVSEYKRVGIFAESGDSRDPISILLSLMKNLGIVSRIVNFHEGDNSYPLDENCPAMQSALAEFHKDLFGLSQNLAVNLVQRLIEQTSSVVRVSANLKSRFDPCSNSALDSLECMKIGTQCIFANIAKLWGAPDWDHSLDLSQNVQQALPYLNRFMRIAPFEGLNIFVFCLPDEYGNSLNKLSRTVKTLLTVLDRNDPKQSRTLGRNLDDPNWRFSYAGEDVFVIATGSCYPESNSRYTFGANKTFVMLQPDFSFKGQRAWVAPQGKKKVTEQIHKRFAANGRPYEDDLLEAGRFVMPLEFGHPIVRWWETEV